MRSSSKEISRPRAIPEALARLLDAPAGKVIPLIGASQEGELVLGLEGLSFAVEWSSLATTGPVAATAELARERARRLSKRAIPLVVVPHMGDSGRRACEAARVAWMDLSGNGHIVAPGLRIIVEGRPNQFKSLGRPSSVFAPKSARIVRWMLMHPMETFKQRELARATDMTEGYVSRIVSRLGDENYLLRVGDHAPSVMRSSAWS